MIRLSIFALLISLSISSSAAAQDARLIEQAKKEGGKLIVYGSLESFTVEPIAEAHLKKTAPKRFKEDFKAAARNPPRINRNITTAVRRAGDGAPTKGADDLVKVQFKGLPSSPPRDPKPNSPGRKR